MALCHVIKCLKLIINYRHKPPTAMTTPCRAVYLEQERRASSACYNALLQACNCKLSCLPAPPVRAPPVISILYIDSYIDNLGIISIAPHGNVQWHSIRVPDNGTVVFWGPVARVYTGPIYINAPALSQTTA